MAKGLRERHVTPGKYLALETYEGPLAALKRLQQDIGSTAEIQIEKHTEEGVGEFYTATIPDIAIAFAGVEDREVWGGIGPTEEDALEMCLDRLLNPDELGRRGQIKDSFLAIGQMTAKPHTVVHIIRPAEEPASNVIQLTPR